MKHLSKLFLVRGYHCDSYGHVNHSRYFEFMEEARWQLLSTPTISDGMASLELQFFLVQINVSYKLPLVPGDEFQIETSFLSNTRKSITLQQEIVKQDGSICTLAQVTFVLFDPSQGKAVFLNDDTVQLFKQFQHA